MSVKVKNLSFQYDKGLKVLKDVSFEIKKGEFVGIMGHTGCGKSTLIQLISGLLTPTSGNIYIYDEDINHKKYDRALLRQKVGIVFQYPEYQLFETTVEKDVAFALKNNKFSQKEIKERVRWALEMMGFSYEDIRKKSPLSLSGGEKRRVAIAGVIVSQPHILIFDEPIAGLDPYGRLEFLKLVKALHQQGTTIIMVSHNIDILCEYTQKMLVFHQGQLIANESTKDIFNNLDFLSKYQMETSQIRHISQKLYERGFLVSPYITNYQEFINEVKDVLNRGQL